MALVGLHIQRTISEKGVETFEYCGPVFDPPESDLHIYDLCVPWFNRSFHISSNSDNYRQRYDNYLRRFNKTSYSYQEKECRLFIYVTNLDRMENRRRKYPEGMLGESKFTDWTQEEKKKLINDKKYMLVPPMKQVALNTKGYQAPSYVNWVTAGMVRPVKDQGQCGSCWAFSAVATIESAYMIKNNVNVSLSEQELVDCDRRYNFGCDGGNDGEAMTYAMRNGLSFDANYPYTADNSQCRAVNDTKIFINDVGRLKPFDVKQLQDWIALRGPVSVGVQPITHAFMDLAPAQGVGVSGVFIPADNCTSDIMVDGGHGLAAVGYGTENGIDYWLLKNSWGTDWGDNGYVKFIRGENACGIESKVYAPIIH